MPGEVLEVYVGELREFDPREKTFENGTDFVWSKEDCFCNSKAHRAIRLAAG